MQRPWGGGRGHACCNGGWVEEGKKTGVVREWLRLERSEGYGGVYYMGLRRSKLRLWI